MTGPEAGPVPSAAPGRVCWITGASTGIGRALALRLARDGRVVAASARGRDRLDSLVTEAAGLPGRIAAFPCDVTQPRQVAAAVAAIDAALGPIDCAVLCAGTHIPMPARAFKADTVQALLDINVMGQAHPIEAVLAGMLARRSGRIAVVSSVAGYVGLPVAAAYGASKAALINLCEALRAELDGSGVVIQLVSPGFVKTPLTDKNDFVMPHLIPAETAADAIAAGLATDRFEIHFPTVFTRQLKFLRMLPYPWMFRIIRRATKPSPP